MNQKQILALISNNPSVETIREAASWIKKKKPTDKAAYRVLREVIQRPQFEIELDGLAAWIKVARWNELLYVAGSTKSVVLFDWLVKLLEDNPGHKQAGELWDAIVSNSRDYQVIVKAAEWFVHHCDSAKSTGLLAWHILTEVQAEPVIQKARTFLGSLPDDFGILLALVQFDHYQPAIDRALTMLKDNDSMAFLVAVALLKNDREKFFPAVEKYLRTQWDYPYVHLYIGECIGVAPDLMFSLFREWIEGHKKSKGVPMLIQGAAGFAPTAEIVDFVWLWCKKRLPEQAAFDVFEHFLGFGQCFDLPPDAVEYAIEWLRTNKGHHLWSSVAESLICSSASRDLLRIGVEPLDDLEEEASGEIFEAMARFSNHPESLKQTRVWREKFPTDKHAMRITLALLERFPDGELIIKAKSAMPIGDRELDWKLLAALVNANDGDSIPLAKSWLTKRQILRRWTSQYHDRGALMLALLDGGHFDGEILALTSEWLRLTAHQYERKLFDRVAKAFEQAESSCTSSQTSD